MAVRSRLIALGLVAFALIPLQSFATPAFANAVTNGTVNIAGLSEASGIAASRNNAGVLWTHNDSGNPAVVFAMDTQGRLLGTYTIPGNTDNEDIAVGPGPVTNVLYLYVGDIGDNGLSRANIKVYQIPEPAIYSRDHTNPVTATLKGARTLTLTYPDGAQNAESLFIDPPTGDLFVITKAATTSRVYTATKAQLDAGGTFALAFVRTVDFDIPSAADISPSGNEILVRQEEFARLWLRTNGQSISSALAGPPISIPVTGTANGEPNGEAIGFDAIGSGYFTISESASAQPLRRFARTSNDGPFEPQVLVAAGSTWRHLANGSNQGTTWRHPGFDDSGWSSGVAQFGYGDGDEKTVVSFGGNAANKYVTTYFRKTFVADDVNCITNLFLKLVVDDGAAVYLNGTPVTFVNLAANASFNTLATATPTALQDTWRSFTVDPRLLVAGTNTLAAEVHLSSVSSTNLSFDLQLIASRIPCTTSLAWTNRQALVSLSGPSNAIAVVQASQTLTNWTNLGGVTLTNGRGTFVDLQATNFASRFYRTAP